MRNINRIYDIMELLTSGWTQVPDWRFGQLIENIKRYSGKDDLFYIEDDEMEKILKEYFDKVENNS